MSIYEKAAELRSEGMSGVEIASELLNSYPYEEILAVIEN